MKATWKAELEVGPHRVTSSGTMELEGERSLDFLLQPKHQRVVDLNPPGAKGAMVLMIKTDPPGAKIKLKYGQSAAIDADVVNLRVGRQPFADEDLAKLASFTVINEGTGEENEKPALVQILVGTRVPVETAIAGTNPQPPNPNPIARREPLVAEPAESAEAVSASEQTAQTSAPAQPTPPETNSPPPSRTETQL